MSPALRIIALLATGVILLVNGAEWNYKEINNWPALCKAGRYQSPIDLDHSNAITANHGKLEFINYLDVTPGNIINNGHTVQFNVGNPKYTVLANGGFDQVYYLGQIHFHWGSEHTFQGLRYPLEVHFVHFSTLYTGIKDALKHHHGVAVVGVLFRESDEDNAFLEPVIDALAMVNGKVGIEIPLNDFVPERLLPMTQSKFYRYEGSLTTPGCNESVVWTVMGNTVAISKQQVAHFNSIKGDKELIGDNFRPVQPTNGRDVFLTLMAGSGTVKIIPSTTIVFTSLLSIYTLVHL